MIDDLSDKYFRCLVSMGAVTVPRVRSSPCRMRTGSGGHRRGARDGLLLYRRGAPR